MDGETGVRHLQATDKYMLLLSTSLDKYKIFSKGLTEEQLQQYNELDGAMMAEAEKNSFKEGLKLGLQLCLEGLKDF